MFRQVLDWLVHGDGPRKQRAKPAAELTRREQLLQAHDSLIHQIAILEAGPAYRASSDFKAHADELRSVLAQIDEQLHGLAAGEA